MSVNLCHYRKCQQIFVITVNARKSPSFETNNRKPSGRQKSCLSCLPFNVATHWSELDKPECLRQASVIGSWDRKQCSPTPRVTTRPVSDSRAPSSRLAPSDSTAIFVSADTRGCVETSRVLICNSPVGKTNERSAVGGGYFSWKQSFLGFVLKSQ